MQQQQFMQAQLVALINECQDEIDSRTKALADVQERNQGHHEECPCTLCDDEFTLTEAIARYTLQRDAYRKRLA